MYTVIREIEMKTDKQIIDQVKAISADLGKLEMTNISQIEKQIIDDLLIIYSNVLNIFEIGEESAMVECRIFLKKVNDKALSLIEKYQK